uniref:Uncharacterized protein n=1 Tax=Kryptolebias marmoratus TaxID=37003 RepID=A0A3Q3AEU1_KRYMA
MASQEIVKHLTQIFSLSQPILKHDIREVLHSHDITVSETLLNEVRFKLRLDGDFSLHYEDPDFDGDLCLLVDIQELPEKGTLKVVRPIASSDTDIFPHVPTVQHQKSWPDHLVVPGFGSEMERILEEGNCVYEESGKLLKLKRLQKSEILKKMAETIYSFKPYPNVKELAMAAQALITAYPCLRMTAGGDSGELGWIRHIGYKLGSYHNNLAKAEVVEVAINTGRQSRNNPNNEHPHENIKKARKAEVNYIINLPKDQTPATLETMREEIIHEVEKAKKNHLVIGMTKYKFHRINNANLRNQFYEELDRYTPKLITLFRDKATKTGKIAEELTKRALILRALPVYLCENASKFFRTCNISVLASLSIPLP